MEGTRAVIFYNRRSRHGRGVRLLVKVVAYLVAQKQKAFAHRRRPKRARRLQAQIDHPPNSTLHRHHRQDAYTAYIIGRTPIQRCRCPRQSLARDGCDNAKLLSSLCRKLPNLTVQVAIFGVHYRQHRRLSSENTSSQSRPCLTGL
jgi:hypothetical protein